jgi:hypothetical protein
MTGKNGQFARIYTDESEDVNEKARLKLTINTLILNCKYES